MAQNNNTVCEHFKYLDTFEDDHMICVNFNYKQLPFSLWWTSLEGAGAFVYKDTSIIAQQILEKFAKVLEEMLLVPENSRDQDEERDNQYTEQGFLDYGHH